MIPWRKIVQLWRSQGWPKYHYSTVTYALSRAKGGTRLAFTQEGVPDNDYRDKQQGWKTHYWQRMKAMLER